MPSYLKRLYYFLHTRIRQFDINLAHCSLVSLRQLSSKFSPKSGRAHKIPCLRIETCLRNYTETLGGPLKLVCFPAACVVLAMEINGINVKDDKQRWLTAELRSDHAGEAGAVAIYDGILAVSRNSEVQAFAHKHRETEKRHLALVEALLPQQDRSVLLPLWRVAGFLTGAIPALFGPNAVFASVAAVETFVDDHYQQQIEYLTATGFKPEIRDILAACREDELEHKDEATMLQSNVPGVFLRGWCWLVKSGSKTAVTLARMG